MAHLVYAIQAFAAERLQIRMQIKITKLFYFVSMPIERLGLR